MPKLSDVDQRPFTTDSRKLRHSLIDEWVRAHWDEDFLAGLRTYVERGLAQLPKVEEVPASSLRAGDYLVIAGKGHHVMRVLDNGDGSVTLIYKGGARVLRSWSIVKRYADPEIETHE